MVESVQATAPMPAYIYQHNQAQTNTGMQPSVFAPTPVDIAAQNLYAAQESLIAQPPTPINYTQDYPAFISSGIPAPVPSGIASVTPDYQPGIDPPITYEFAGAPVVSETIAPNIPVSLPAPKRPTRFMGGRGRLSNMAREQGTQGQTVGDTAPIRGGGMSKPAQELAARGRRGDTTLAHINPLELEGIARLFPHRPITRNPDTGLPEMFNFMSILPTIVGVGASLMGVPPIWSAALSGATTAATTGDIGKGIMGGLLSYGAGSVLGEASESAAQAASRPVDVSEGLAHFDARPAPTFLGVDARPAALSPAAVQASSSAHGAIPASGILPQSPTPSPWGEPGIATTGNYVPPAVPDVPIEPPVQVSKGGLVEGIGKQVRDVGDFFDESLYWNWEDTPGYTAAGGEEAARELGYRSVSDMAVPFGAAGIGALGTIVPMLEEEYDPYRPEEFYGNRARAISPREYRTAVAPPLGYDPATEGEWSYYGAGGGIAGDLPMIYAQSGYGQNDKIDRAAEMLAARRPDLISRPPPQMLPTQQVRQQAMRPPLNIQARQEQLARYMPSAGMPSRAYAQEGTEGMLVEDIEETPMAAEEISSIGIMEGAPEIVQEGVREEAMLTRPPSDPQNAEERAIYDRAILALEGELEVSDARDAVDEYIEVFGADAYRALKDLVDRDRGTGGIVEPANGETTVADGEMQGEDVMAGKVVNPVTGEETANLRVAENEYIKTGASLARQAAASGLPATPENGAMVEGIEEEALRRAYG